ncbi:MAG: hydroxymethylglutaryl-CoA reductase [Desulfobacteraceae bacterium]|nr:hydroxymethylglutaryl-CoA reductase [Desulfobacteraceae bacterium]MBC2757350.1 hydroxymethylglutaryl-CoA reductase [Desulfobacteraceae bacterium]MBC2763936.1 hydroxymethylglutaryl-CoA reductase [ANME-2 cluster archaeon]
MEIPSMILKKLYATGSLSNVKDGVHFCLTNPLGDATLTGISKVEINGNEMPLDKVIATVEGQPVKASEVDTNNPIRFLLGQTVDIHVQADALEEDKEHCLSFAFQTEPFGPLNFEVQDTITKQDTITEKDGAETSIPHDRAHNYETEIIQKRQAFIEAYSGVTLEHIDKYSFDPKLTQGNIENFTGVAQVPIGFAGPLKINGEHADGEFLIPLATTEGTLVASYNRGIKMINLCGGITTTILDDVMQRAPGFIFDSAREARAFARWIDENIEDIRKQAEATSNIAKLIDIQKFLTSKLVYLRFNYTTGDAAGQNMVTAATFAACNWILDHFKGIRRHYMDGNMTTDKKTSVINTLHTRGKRVTAEVILKRDLLIEQLRVDPETCEYYMQVSSLGTFMAGGSSNGVQNANALAALFIATGQDVANVVESSTGMVHMETTSEGDLYASLTLPSLIVGTYGGGTGLPTQRECLEILGCYGEGKALKFAEIVTAVAAAGEISLGAAVSSLEWVSAHEKLGRNR